MNVTTLVLPNDIDTPVTARRGGSFAYRYAYARSADTREAGEPGQDYLTLRHNDRRIVFAVCDGVSQSFYGDLAAAFLGNALLEWLWTDLPDVAAPVAVQEALCSYLLKLTGPATAMIREYRLPGDLPPLLHSVLEQKRALGSESMFACGRIDIPPSATLAADAAVTLAWMGDIRMKLWRPGAGVLTDLGAESCTAQRWSTRTGLVGGTPGVYAGGWQEAALAVYTDGLAVLDSVSEPAGNQVLQSLINDAGNRPDSDDIAYLEITKLSLDSSGQIL